MASSPPPLKLSGPSRPLLARKTLAKIRAKFLREEAAQAQTDETLKRLEQAVLERAFRGEL
jgi:hypothetical protein